MRLINPKEIITFLTSMRSSKSLDETVAGLAGR